MKQLSFLFLTFHFLLIFSCGHSSYLLEIASEEALPPPPETQEKDSLKQAREELAAEFDTNPPPPIIPISPPQAQALQESAPPTELDAFIQQIVSFNEGSGAGYGQSLMTELLLGPPYGEGQFSGSTDVVSLGNNGVIVLGFKNFIPIDGSGIDFIVFENAFQTQGGTTSFIEPAIVGVSQDGRNFVDFPCSLTPPYEGCAGTHFVLANPELNKIDPRDPMAAGGDAYDLSQLGLKFIQFIRIRDTNLNLGGNVSMQAGQSGFDLDAISIVHGAKP